MDAQYEAIEKEARLKKVRALGITYERRLNRVRDDYSKALRTLFPEIKMHLTPYGGGGAWDRTYIASLLMDPKVRALKHRIQDLADKLRKEQREATAKRVGQLTDCGVRLPKPDAAKKVLADKHLKTLVDAVTK